MEIEFTDRYGDRAPSWLRGCHGDCEAMGWVPLVWYLEPPTPGELRVIVDDPTDRRAAHAAAGEQAAWQAAHAAAGEHDCDGWHFVRCYDCRGTGRVSWWRTAARIPRWLRKGVAFYGQAMRPEISPDGWSWWRRFQNYANAAFIADLRALRR